MKTMKLGNEIIRVKEEDVDLYLSKGWTFCPRSEWKKNVRDKKEDKDTKENKKGHRKTGNNQKK